MDSCGWFCTLKNKFLRASRLCNTALDTASDKTSDSAFDTTLSMAINTTSVEAYDKSKIHVIWLLIRILI